MLARMPAWSTTASTLPRRYIGVTTATCRKAVMIATVEGLPYLEPANPRKDILKTMGLEVADALKPLKIVAADQDLSITVDDQVVQYA